MAALIGALAAVPHSFAAAASGTPAAARHSVGSGLRAAGFLTGAPSRDWLANASFTGAVTRKDAQRRSGQAHRVARAAHHVTVTAKPAKPAKPAASCSGGGGGMLPANYATIVPFLMAHGYTGTAAAGIAGNIYQESGGNPESVGTGGGGLIGWTPLPAGYVTGNPAADLQTQLAALLSFNQLWAQYIPALNSAATPAQAADIYVTDFERAGIPAASNREAAAEAVAAACGI